MGIAKIQTEPHQTSAPIYIATSSSLTSISLSWAGIVASSTDTGGSPIISYNIQWRTSGASSWTDGQGQDGSYSTLKTYTLNSGVVGGDTYVFQVLAKNIHGWGTASNSLVIIASGIPDAPAAPTTTLDSLTVKIAWVAPSHNYAAITEYKIAITDSAGAQIVETTYCDGSNSLIFGQRYCQVPMDHIRSSYGLAYDTLILVRVQAYNLNGWSSWSADNSVGQRVETAPAIMVLPTEGALTSEA